MRIRIAAIALLLGACGPAGRDGPANKAAEAPPPVQFRQASADRLAHSERVARVLGCVGCHGEALTGNDWSAPDIVTMHSSNLSRVARRHDDAQLIAMITTGRRPDGSELWSMPSHLFTALTPDDMNSVIAFVRSKPEAGVDHPRPRFGARGQSEIDQGIWPSAAADVRTESGRWPPQAPGDHRLARYIVRATCAECHGMDLAGGRVFPGEQPRPNLRLVAGYERDQFRRLLREGVAAGDRPLRLMAQVARGRYRHLTDAEIDALYVYLRALGLQL
ncbi:MAG TPA: c-type cytochrome [Allosphingosinicella sp.]|nr:c-type cytochrome [Allosphingosinicella sp.]